jgi:asparagine synthetase B (glutamine-hydrolysing)
MTFCCSRIDDDATSLECRVPLLDHELVELAASIPGDVKIKGGELKYLMKEALADLLPATFSTARNVASARQWARGLNAISRRCYEVCFRRSRSRPRTRATKRRPTIDCRP